MLTEINKSEIEIPVSSTRRQYTSSFSMHKNNTIQNIVMFFTGTYFKII